MNRLPPFTAHTIPAYMMGGCMLFGAGWASYVGTRTLFGYNDINLLNKGPEPYLENTPPPKLVSEEKARKAFIAMRDGK
eukprot:CAMPEP_0174250250 /NCGR_PEP_ID=MMETSP0439-20130205/483_1 /TAXON_ID=0 /ORGANISM="Stereomyxa ramosa, Strain Chinc5" /LENGTH=78 /DNA_ID=CAMNT_0015330269 /DNA_START=102 /DNA_END=338 /DNA_ORIENTATION=-